LVAKGLTLADAPGAGERTVVERPPPGLGRGARSVPAAAVIALTAILVVLTLTYYVLRFRRRREK
jgi:hypothetical protein